VTSGSARVVRFCEAELLRVECLVMDLWGSGRVDLHRLGWCEGYRDALRRVLDVLGGGGLDGAGEAREARGEA